MHVGVDGDGQKAFLSALARKMSANERAITASKPKSASAHTACSRDEPQPKLLPASSTRASPVASKRAPRQSANSCAPSPARPVVFKKRAGMI